MTTTDRTPRHLAPRERSRLAQSALATLPIVLAGSLAMSMNLTGPLPAAADANKRPPKDKASTPSELRQNIRQALASAGSAAQDGLADNTATESGASVAAVAPASYTVAAGDTVSGIATRYGLSTASVLALNGLGWSSIIYPGQQLVLRTGAAPVTPAPAPAPAPSPAPAAGSYTIIGGDTVSGIAARFGLTTQALLSANGLGWSTIIYPGQKLVLPGASTAPAPAPAPTPPPAASSTSYRIVSGDTLSGIAARFGVSLPSILSANNLQLSSIIYAGRTLTIPGGTGTSGSTTTPVAPPSGGNIVALTPEMEQHARTIVSVGRSLGVSDYGLVIALATAAQESTLRNLNWGDLDSVGLFQQRPSAGWGTIADLTTPEHAAKLFYGGPTNPNKGKTRGLLDIVGWQSMSVTQAAQAVQISAYPDAYAKWETSARAWLAQIS